MVQPISFTHGIIGQTWCINMGIKITNSEVKPQLVYDHVFLSNLNLAQDMIKFNDEDPKYDLIFDYRLYAIDEDGKYHYKSKTDRVVLRDYYKKAVEKAMTGDTDLLDALKHLQEAIAGIIEDQTELGEAQIV